jgi:hypothetical protein
MIYQGFLFWLPPQTQHGTVTVEFMNRAIEAEREACAKLAEQYGPNRPIVAVRPSERIRGQWEGEQAASSGISAAIRARGQRTPERGQA